MGTHWVRWDPERQHQRSNYQTAPLLSAWPEEKYCIPLFFLTAVPTASHVSLWKPPTKAKKKQNHINAPACRIFLKTPLVRFILDLLSTLFSKQLARNSLLSVFFKPAWICSEKSFNTLLSATIRSWGNWLVKWSHKPFAENRSYLMQFLPCGLKSLGIQEAKFRWALT